MPPPKLKSSIRHKLHNLSSAFASIPCSHEATIHGHTANVGALDIDKSGSRMATGGDDYIVRLWDFHGMNKSMNSFKLCEPMV